MRSERLISCSQIRSLHILCWSEATAVKVKQDSELEADASQWKLLQRVNWAPVVVVTRRIIHHNTALQRLSVNSGCCSHWVSSDRHPDLQRPAGGVFPAHWAHPAWDSLTGLYKTFTQYLLNDHTMSSQRGKERRPHQSRGSREGGGPLQRTRLDPDLRITANVSD